MLPLRCPSFVSGFGKSINKLYEFRIEDILKTLDVTYEQFVDICILCGCDNAGKITAIGPKRALPLIKEYNTIENIINEYIKPNKSRSIRHIFSDEFIDEVKQARDIFYHAHYIEKHLEDQQELLKQFESFKWILPELEEKEELFALLEECGVDSRAQRYWIKSFQNDNASGAHSASNQNTKVNEPIYPITPIKPIEKGQKTIFSFFNKLKTKH
jgi:5'-3' exonuclease